MFQVHDRLGQIPSTGDSTQHSTTGVSPHMMLTGHEKSLPLTFVNPEYEGKKTSRQVYVWDVIRRQQELNDLFLLVTRAMEKQHVDPENLVLSLTRLRDFLVSSEFKGLTTRNYV